VTLLVLWGHLLGAVVWLGGLVYQAHVLGSAVRAPTRGLRPDGPAAFAEAAARARPATWAAIALVVLTGFVNVTRLGPLERVMESGAALWLAGKFLLVLVAVALAGHRDFAQVPRLRRALAGGDDPEPALGAIAWLDRLVIVLGLAILYLGLAVSRAR
jgi:uncharacterized membrane protein